MCHLDEFEERGNLFKELITKIVKEEYGGCDPSTDNPCILKAMVSDGKKETYKGRRIYVWVVGSWRCVGRTGWKGLPSNKAITEAIQTIRLNSGKTFNGKEIMLQFEKFNVSADTLGR